MGETPIITSALRSNIATFFDEDDLSRNFYYLNSLPQERVRCSLYAKVDLILAGIPYFFESFKYLGAEIDYSSYQTLEGKFFPKNKERAIIEFDLPFSVALTGERIALNLLQHASSIATYTNRFVEKAKAYNIAILDTRKTTPGLRSLEKYAVRVGGGHNHRLGQSDVWMVKDNHKSFFGGIPAAVNYFRSMQGFYTPIEVEVHNLDEIKIAEEAGVKHLMLDNFSPEEVREAIKRKSSEVTYEVSGGVTLANLESYLLRGVDAISIGAITYNAPRVDLSLKYSR